MIKRQYKTMEEVQLALKAARLQKDIALAELEGSKLEVEEQLRPFKILSYATTALKKYGTFYLIRRLFK
ncbi:MAG: hypothetical protein CMH48_13275 [Muricauda sp.]|jgi:hypothetical protein|nr:hypothetical protein [Allomuricauda sp.]MBC31801.1 hypothetical protein [Allomuricauda sp.]|tara:strand:- start:2015 stop:2221 length:207 start_codon:yes stop_codon:yes gene_type:complete